MKNAVKRTRGSKRKRNVYVKRKRPRIQKQLQRKRSKMEAGRKPRMPQIFYQLKIR
jgi:hypothetical protein